MAREWKNRGTERLGRGFSVLVGLVLALGLALYFTGKAGKDLSLHAFEGSGVPETEARVAGFIHSIDASGRNLTVREAVRAGFEYRIVLLSPATEFLVVGRTRGVEALDHPLGARRIRLDEIGPGDYVVVSAAPSAEGLRAAIVTIARRARDS